MQKSYLICFSFKAAGRWYPQFGDMPIRTDVKLDYKEICKVREMIKFRLEEDGFKRVEGIAIMNIIPTA